MDARPQIKIELSVGDKIVEGISWVVALGMMCFAVWSYTHLPPTIPMHFDGAGKPDNYGGKASIFVLPLIGSILFGVLTVLNNYPQSFNYPTEITPENAQKKYTIATRMIRALKLVIAAIFFSILLGTYATATGQASGLGVAFLPVTVGLLFVVLAYYIVKLIKA